MGEGLAHRRGSMTTAAAALCAAFAAGFQQRGGDLCGECGTTGRIVNPWFAAHAAAERGSLRCSDCLLGDKAGRNSSFLACPRCKRPDLKAKAEQELAEWKGRQEAWLAQRAGL